MNGHSLIDFQGNSVGWWLRWCLARIRITLNTSLATENTADNDSVRLHRLVPISFSLCVKIQEEKASHVDRDCKDTGNWLEPWENLKIWENNLINVSLGNGKYLLITPPADCFQALTWWCVKRWETSLQSCGCAITSIHYKYYIHTYITYITNITGNIWRGV